MAEDDYKPLWQMCSGPQSIKEDLVIVHGWTWEQVNKLSDRQCWAAHDHVREQTLGRDWLRG